MKALSRGLSVVALLFFVNGCGSSNSSSENIYTQEVNGPAGDYSGATEFVPGMFSERQTIYTYDEKDAKWYGVAFDPNGEMTYESTSDIAVGSTYTIADGRMYIIDMDKNPIIKLNIAKATTFEVIGEDNDGRIWQDTWYLELKFKPEMLEGKCYLSEYNDRGEMVHEKVCLSRTTLDTYTEESTLKHSYPYRLENNILAVNGDDGDFTLHLMSITGADILNVWYVSKPENYANNASWTPID